MRQRIKTPTIFWQGWPRAQLSEATGDETRELETREIYAPLLGACERPLSLMDTIPDALYVEPAADQSREVTRPRLRFADIEELTLQPLAPPRATTAATAATRRLPGPRAASGRRRGGD